jgi:hypothetical protein
MFPAQRSGRNFVRENGKKLFPAMDWSENETKKSKRKNVPTSQFTADSDVPTSQFTDDIPANAGPYKKTRGSDLNGFIGALILCWGNPVSTRDTFLIGVMVGLHWDMRISVHRSSILGCKAYRSPGTPPDTAIAALVGLAVGWRSIGCGPCPLQYLSLRSCFSSHLTSYNTTFLYNYKYQYRHLS